MTLPYGFSLKSRRRLATLRFEDVMPKNKQLRCVRCDSRNVVRCESPHPPQLQRCIICGFMWSDELMSPPASSSTGPTPNRPKAGPPPEETV